MVPIDSVLSSVMIDDIKTFYVKVGVRKSTYWQRDGIDIYTKVDVDPETAIFGGSVSIRGLHSPNLKLTIPAETSSHQILSIRGEGIKIHGVVEGDHHVEVGINMLELSKKTEKFLQDIGKKNNVQIESEDEIIHPVVVAREFRSKYEDVDPQGDGDVDTSPFFSL